MFMRYFISCMLTVLILIPVGCSSGVIRGKSYIGNKKSRIFHYCDCKWAQKISSKNAVIIDSRKDAIKVYHMRPCKSCRP